MRDSFGRSERLVALLWLSLLLPSVVGCQGCATDDAPRVVVYCALDAEFAEPILAAFTRDTGVRVDAKFDTESTKTIGLTEALRAERDRPRCDVFWNNEILNTLRLEREGLLDVYAPSTAENYPLQVRSIDGRWHGFAARARVLIVNTDLVPVVERPTSIRDLTLPAWRGRFGLAKPLFGTTATHAACLFAAWGEASARSYLLALKANGAQILGGNKDVARRVALGQLAVGMTDTDDAIIELESGRPVAIIFPDQGADQSGTLFIPNTLAVMRGAPHNVEARRLIDYLLTAQVEERLAAGPSAQIPLGRDAKQTPRPHMAAPHTVKAMVVDFHAAAEAWDATARFLRDEFLAP